MENQACDIQNRPANDTGYFGKYRGEVADNKDPENRGRLRLFVRHLGENYKTAWALPCLPFGGAPETGMFFIPDNGSRIWVEFEQGDINFPIWTGTYWDDLTDPPAEAQPEENDPVRRAFKTPSGHVLLFDDMSDKEIIRLFHSGGAFLEMDEAGRAKLSDNSDAAITLDAEAGEIVIADANGNVMTMSSAGTKVEDSNGNIIEMASAGVTVSADKIVLSGTSVMLGGEGGEPVIKGQSFLSLFMTHMHPSAMGPTGPPIPQGEMSTLSTTVMTT